MRPVVAEVLLFLQMLFLFRLKSLCSVKQNCLNVCSQTSCWLRLVRRETGPVCGSLSMSGLTLKELGMQFSDGWRFFSGEFSPAHHWTSDCFRTVSKSFQMFMVISVCYLLKTSFRWGIVTEYSKLIYIYRVKN